MKLILIKKVINFNFCFCLHVFIAPLVVGNRSSITVTAPPVASEMRRARGGDGVRRPRTMAFR